MSLQSLMTRHKTRLRSCPVSHGHAAVCSYPFDSLQVSLQQTVQGKGDDVVHVLELEEGEERVNKVRSDVFKPAGVSQGL